MKAIVEEVRGTEWPLLGGLSKHPKAKEVADILATVKVPETPQSFVHATRTGAVHTTKATARLWGFEREVVVYTNAERAINDRTSATRPSRTLASADRAVREGEGVVGGEASRGDPRDSR